MEIIQLCLNFPTTHCYLCGARGASLSIEKAIKPTFTDHSRAKIPDSPHICKSCVYYLNLRCYYFNPNKEKWSKLFARNWSWLETPKKSYPTIKGIKEDLPIVSDLPSRKDILGTILHPPKPPFLIAIARSGQKHIRPWAVKAKSRDYFPVLFEQDLIYLQLDKFIAMEKIFKGLRLLGFSKTGILSGNYNSAKLLANFTNPKFQELEERISIYRGGQNLELLAYLH